MQINNILISIKINNDIKHYLSVVRSKYKINTSAFIRDAIIEKMKRDVPNIRKQHYDKKLPF